MQFETMHIRNVHEIEKEKAARHGETALYQYIFGTQCASAEELPATKKFSCFWKMTVEAGGTNQLHDHDDQEQIYFILEGEGTMVVGDEKEKVKQGDAIYLPVGLPHGLNNDSNKPCVVLCVGTYI